MVDMGVTWGYALDKRFRVKVYRAMGGYIGISSGFWVYGFKFSGFSGLGFGSFMESNG